MMMEDQVHEDYDEDYDDYDDSNVAIPNNDDGIDNDDDNVTPDAFLNNGMDDKNYISVALIGSSGGGTATLGHTQPEEFIQLLSKELEDKVTSASSPTTPSHSTQKQPVLRLKYIIFISLDNGNGFDTASIDEEATLYYSNGYDDKGGEDTILRRYRGTLQELNDKIRQLQKTELADRMIRRRRRRRQMHPSDIDALICVSCKPDLFP